MRDQKCLVEALEKMGKDQGGCLFRQNMGKDQGGGGEHTIV